MPKLSQKQARAQLVFGEPGGRLLAMLAQHRHQLRLGQRQNLGCNVRHETDEEYVLDPRVRKLEVATLLLKLRDRDVTFRDVLLLHDLDHLSTDRCLPPNARSVPHRIALAMDEGCSTGGAAVVAAPNHTLQTFGAEGMHAGQRGDAVLHRAEAYRTAGHLIGVRCESDKVPATR